MFPGDSLGVKSKWYLMDSLCYIWQSVSGDFFVILHHDKYTAYEKDICYDVAVAGYSRDGADSLEEGSVWDQQVP